MDKFHHVFERSAGEEDFVHAFLAHQLRVVMRDRSAAAAKNLDIVGPFLAEKIDNLGEELNVAAVVTGNADRTDVLLNRSANNIADRPVITEIDDLDPVADELEIDRVDRAVVPVANRDGG